MQLEQQLDQKPQLTAAAPNSSSSKQKIRRTRQPRDPQVSVARRNERERNRVKMVNNAFANLREHLPQELVERLVCDSKGKGKKFSKVETLRTAIQHIKNLVEVLNDGSELASTSEAIADELSASVYSVAGAASADICSPMSMGCQQIDSPPLAWQYSSPASASSLSVASSVAPPSISDQYQQQQQQPSLTSDLYQPQVPTSDQFQPQEEAAAFVPLHDEYQTHAYLQQQQQQQQPLTYQHHHTSHHHHTHQQHHTYHHQHHQISLYSQ